MSWVVVEDYLLEKVFEPAARYLGKVTRALDQ